MDNDEEKKINITGTNNRYMIKKLTKKTNNIEIKKRVESKNWNFSSDVYEITTQKKIINDISLNNFEAFDEKSNILVQQVNKKISQQLSLIFNNKTDNFLNNFYL